MMKIPTMDIKIDKTGKLTVEISGTPGPECLKVADMLAKIVGIENSRSLTAEYHQAPPNVRIDVQGGSQVHGRVGRG